jgi:hypothetical protein
VLLAFQREEVDFIIETLEASSAFNVCSTATQMAKTGRNPKNHVLLERSAWVDLAKYFRQLSASSSSLSIIYVWNRDLPNRIWQVDLLIRNEFGFAVSFERDSQELGRRSLEHVTRFEDSGTDDSKLEWIPQSHCKSPNLSSWFLPRNLSIMNAKLNFFPPFFGIFVEFCLR